MSYLELNKHIQQSELPIEVKKFRESELPFPLIQFEDARIEFKTFFTKYQFKELHSHKADYQLFLLQSLKSQVKFETILKVFCHFPETYFISK